MQIKIVKIIQNHIKDKDKVMSKNSAIQTYEASKAFAQIMENKRKRSGIKPKVKAKSKNHYPTLEYNED